MATDTWQSKEDAPAPQKMNVASWLRVIARSVPLLVLVFGGLALTLILRLIEGPLFGQRRPITPFITVFVCRVGLRTLGIKYVTHGHVMRGAGAVVSNHASWLDIFALNAAQRIYFVSKAEVASWPGIGWLARATGTVFIKRDRTQAAAQVGVFQNRLAAGHKLLFFPEGTSTDGRQVLPFKPTLFAAFFDPKLYETLQIQPVTLSYHAPDGADSRLYGWWGDMDFGPHLLATLATRKQGRVEVVFHPPVSVAQYVDRKTLAAALEKTVRGGLKLSDDR